MKKKIKKYSSGLLPFDLVENTCIENVTFLFMKFQRYSFKGKPNVSSFFWPNFSVSSVPKDFECVEVA